MRLTGGEALAQQLVREGVRQIFGVPGVQLDYAVDGLARVSGQIPYWNTRHEQATSYMADGYARASGQIGVCMVVPGPGLLNALAGVATAFACSSRVLCIAGQIPSTAIGRGFGLLHEIPEQSQILAALTKCGLPAPAPPPKSLDSSTKQSASCAVVARVRSDSRCHQMSSRPAQT
jgi:acetolactate synthase-1/2/3 large subunit